MELDEVIPEGLFEDILKIMAKRIPDLKVITSLLLFASPIVSFNAIINRNALLSNASTISHSKITELRMAMGRNY